MACFVRMRHSYNCRNGAYIKEFEEQNRNCTCYACKQLKEFPYQYSSSTSSYPPRSTSSSLFPCEHPFRRRLQGISPPIQSIFAMKPEIGEGMMKKLVVSMLTQVDENTEKVERRVVRQHGFVGKKDEEEGLQVLRSALFFFPEDEEVAALSKNHQKI
uniref:Uncharacterized protein n=1 Tax=Paramoeba aestuarina TaxID=180227 RepID=A0A7S4KLL4_9EUKA|mmetsp:Transcript_21282/g.33098  ORF Transcript_21282/g.33098 Transcript_21282/m.33098 type:complete len:158 (+) Transcript_21282:146-619(+)